MKLLHHNKVQNPFTRIVVDNTVIHFIATLLTTKLTPKLKTIALLKQISCITTKYYSADYCMISSLSSKQTMR